MSIGALLTRSTALLVLLGCAGLARAAYYYGTDQTIAKPLDDSVIVGYATHFDYISRQNPRSPTVTVTAGGQILYGPSGAFNGSTVVLAGGHIQGFGASDNATINALSGTFASLSATGNATVNVDGAEGGALDSNQAGTVNVISGKFGTLRTSAVMNIYGGSTNPIFGSGNILMVEDGQLFMTGGSVTGALQTQAQFMLSDGTLVSPRPMAQLTGGSISGNILARASAQVTLDGAVVGSVEGRNVAEIDMSEGEVRGNVTLWDSSRFSLTGGRIGGNLTTTNSSISLEASDATVMGSVVLASGNGTFERMVVGQTLSGGTGTLAITDSILGGLAAGGVVTMSQSSVAGLAEAYQDGDFSIVDSDLGSLAGWSGTVRMTGGEIAQDLALYGTSIFSVDVDSVGGSVDVGGSSRLDLVAATVGGNVSAGSSARVTVHDAAIAGNVTLYGQSRFSMQNGRIEGDLSSGGSSPITLSETDIGGLLSAGGDSEVTVAGGTLGGIAFYAWGGGSLRVSDATVSGAMDTDAGASLLTNTSIGGYLAVDGAADVEMSQGTIGGPITVKGWQAKLQLTDVTVNQSIEVHDDGEVRFSGGTVAEDSWASGNGRFFATGGTIHGLGAFGHSRVELDGAMVSTAVNARDEATLLIRSGAVAGHAIAFDNSTLVMRGGAVGGGVGAYESATVELTGGQVFGGPAGGSPRIGFVVADSAHLLFNGATAFQGGTVRGSAVAEILSGQIVGTINVSETARLLISGGDIHGDVNATGDAIVTLDGAGRVADMHVRDNAQLSLIGGVVQNVESSGNAVTTMRGGHVAAAFQLRDSARLQFEGGEIDHLQAWGNSSVMISNGRVDFAVDVSGNASAVIANIGPGDGPYPFAPMLSTSGHGVATFNGGSLNSIFARSDSRVTMNGGTVDSGNFLSGDQVRLRDRSHITFNGGDIRTPVYVDGFSRFTMTGGRVLAGAITINSVIASGHSNVLILGGVIGDSLEAHDASTVQLSGGTVHRLLMGFDNSLVIMTGGQVDDQAVFRGNSTFAWAGGTILRNIIRSSAESNLIGAAASSSPNDAILLTDNATLNIYGTDLSSLLIDGDYQGMYSLYQVTGTLADGSSIEGGYFTLANGSAATFALLPPSELPEPSAVLLALPAASLLLRRAKARGRSLGAAMVTRQLAGNQS